MEIIKFDSGITQPEDKGLLLKDIIENSVSSTYDSQTFSNHVKGSGRLNNNYKSQSNSIHDINSKLPAICAGTHGYVLGHIERPCEPKDFNKDSLCHHAGTMGGGNREPKLLVEQLNYRKLTPLECERLQTVPENYTNHVSNTQRYKMLGNGWTVDVIAHIFKGLI